MPGDEQVKALALKCAELAIEIISMERAMTTLVHRTRELVSLAEQLTLGALVPTTHAGTGHVVVVDGDTADSLTDEERERIKAQLGVDEIVLGSASCEGLNKSHVHVIGAEVTGDISAFIKSLGLDKR